MSFSDARPPQILKDKESFYRNTQFDYTIRNVNLVIDKQNGRERIIKLMNVINQ